MIYCIKILNGSVNLIVVEGVFLVVYVNMIVIIFVIIGLGGCVLLIGVNLVKVNFVKLLVIILRVRLFKIVLVIVYMIIGWNIYKFFS